MDFSSRRCACRSTARPCFDSLATAGDTLPIQTHQQADASPEYVNGVVQKLAGQVASSNKLLNSEPLRDAEQISHIAFAFMVSD
jgi:hypothetical protein